MTHTKALARLLRALDVAADDGAGHLAPWADWNNGNGDACGPELDAAIAEARAALDALQSTQPSPCNEGFDAHRFGYAAQPTVPSAFFTVQTLK